MKGSNLKDLAPLFTLVISSFLLIWTGIAWIGTQNMINKVKERSDMAVFLKENLSPLQMQELIEALKEVEGVSEVRKLSEQEVLERFLQGYQRNIEVIRSLEEIGENPFPPLLEIRAQNFSALKRSAELLSQERFAEMISKLDFYQRETVLERLFAFSDFLEKAGIVILVFLGSISFLVNLNTVYLFLGQKQQEIEVQKTLGAGDLFVLRPFLLHWLVLTFFATVLSNLLVGVSAFIVSEYLEIRFDNLVPWQIFIGDFPYFVGGTIIFVSVVYLASLLWGYWQVKKEVIIK